MLDALLFELSDQQLHDLVYYSSVLTLSDTLRICRFRLSHTALPALDEIVPLPTSPQPFTQSTGGSEGGVEPCS